LSAAATLYDPLGYLIPVTIRTRMFLQKLWKEKYTWDQELHIDLQHEWNELACDLQQALAFKLPRQLIFSEDVILHVFGDAS
jgi:hypothetical protein